MIIKGEHINSLVPYLFIHTFILIGDFFKMETMKTNFSKTRWSEKVTQGQTDKKDGRIERWGPFSRYSIQQRTKSRFYFVKAAARGPTGTPPSSPPRSRTSARQSPPAPPRPASWPGRRRRRRRETRLAEREHAAQRVCISATLRALGIVFIRS